MDMSSLGGGALSPQTVTLEVVGQVALLLLKPSDHKLYRRVVRWLTPGELFVSAGMPFL